MFLYFLQGLNGFIMMTTQTGKLLYISDNAAEYLGHSMVSNNINSKSGYNFSSAVMLMFKHKFLNIFIIFSFAETNN